MTRGAEKQAIDVVAGSDPLQRLVRAQRVFEALDERIQTSLSTSARGKIRVACVDGATLVLVASSSAWASRARLEAARALATAQEVWPETLSEVRVIVSAGQAG
ncbi:MAG: DciA family protein [Wenzhouxiangella sp.]